MKVLTTRGLVIIGSLVAFTAPVHADSFPGSDFLCSTLSIGCPPPPPPPPPPAPVAEEPAAAPVKKVKKRKKKAKKAAESKADAAQ